jgi:hypothetical protein
MDIDNALLYFDEALDALSLSISGADLTVKQNYVDVTSEREPMTPRYIPAHREATLTLTIVGDPESLIAIAQRSGGTIRFHGN